jgi:hypothetical protein
MKYCPRALKRFDISYIQRYNLNTYININWDIVEYKILI